MGKIVAMTRMMLGCSSPRSALLSTSDRRLRRDVGAASGACAW